MTLAPNKGPDPPPADITRRLLALRDDVMAHWMVMARREVRGARHLPEPLLADTLPAFYDNLAKTLTPGYPRALATEHNNAASQHGGERARLTPYGPEQVIHEYQLFRAAIYEMAAVDGIALDAAQRARIEAAIDTAQREAIREFSAIHEDLRRKLAATLSHDMLSPLATIVSGAELIGLATDVTAARRTGRRILENGQRLGHMIAQLLDALTVTGVDRVPLEPSAFDIRLLMRTVCEEFSAQQVEIAIEGEPVEGWWDFAQLQRALENLVRNAVKYGDGSQVTIRSATTHGRLTLSVHNTGNPIAADRFEHIFAYLHRENVVPAEGYGIGLSFVKSVAESHGGSIVVDSSSVAGTTFLIDVPIDCRPFTGG
ncbi:HAMP domain-containing sensor histidine kinase [Massilia sp. METH4]|uniref:sensor histidine kinase n=1 Tax=Massilia sp. METH4 TaxID=3123041 RepID=UPI0030D40592